MSKFAAWVWQPRPLNSHGIPIRSMNVHADQPRNCIEFGIQDEFADHTKEVAVSSEIAALPKENLVDDNSSTVWSSNLHTTPYSEEWFAFWFHTKPVNMLHLTPRRVNGNAVGFPVRITIGYSAKLGSREPDWIPIKHLTLVNPPHAAGEDLLKPIEISLDKTIITDGLVIKATQLSTDDSGINYYLQIAEAKACLRFATLDEDDARNQATCYPDSLFFLGDEPDNQRVPPDQYALAYDRFVQAVKRGSSRARVSPGGFCNLGKNYPGVSWTDYAELFRLARSAPLDEWRFHGFYDASVNSYSIWEAKIKEAAAWCVREKMVLGSFGAPGDIADARENHKRAMRMISLNDRIIEAVYCSFFHRTDTHNLSKDQEGTALTEDGEVFLEYM